MRISNISDKISPSVSGIENLYVIYILKYFSILICICINTYLMYMYICVYIYIHIYTFMFYIYTYTYITYGGFLGGSMVKNPPTNARDSGVTGSIPESGRSTEEGNGNSLQYSCLGNPMDRRAWRATVHGVSKSQTQLSNWEHTHAYNIQMCRHILYTHVLHFSSL